MTYRLLILLVVSFISLFSYAETDEAFLQHLQKGDSVYLEKARKEGNRLASLFLSYTSSNKVVSLDCDKNNNFYFKYYCFYLNYSSNYKNNDYYEAKRYLEMMLNHLNTNSDFSALKQPVVEKINILNILNKVTETPVLRSGTLKLENFKKELTINHKNIVFTLDTGSEFNSLSIDENSEFGGAINVTSVQGGTKGFDYIIRKSDTSDTNHLFIVSPNYNLLGRSYFKNYNILLFGNGKNNTLTVPLRDDGQNIYFIGELSIGDNKFSGINYCLDTGSIKTFVAPKMYLKLRNNLLSVGVSTFSIDSFTGNQSALGKVIPKFKLTFGSQPYILKNVPAYFRSKRVDICDVVLGQDFLKKTLVSIDFKNNQIIFSHESDL
ncbi:hypothetical protein [Pseudoalteromonas sp. SR43-5]|uniref:hypothetical protein n=1 Tax=Pseudoalteromonas sp. SR43-5 TaxID=2760941 RepID=UPI0015FE0FC3|nr:hypothetical protein [Pseudoalteromonas sp. SR43-5]MBB1307775.1 hypothetical protein [Pseudoalteromonas sp. SR43-5]